MTKNELYGCAFFGVFAAGVASTTALVIMSACEIYVKKEYIKQASRLSDSIELLNKLAKIGSNQSTVLKDECTEA